MKSLRAACMMAAFVLTAIAALESGDRLLTEAEIASMERENGMLRLANPDEGLAANVTRLKQAGYTAEEVAAFQPRLAALWAVPFERNPGWLRPETLERIRAVDKEFIGRMRAVQLYAQAGVQAAGKARENPAEVNRQWRVAILNALDLDELKEFRLMNSSSARQEMRLTRGLTLTADEQRTLFEWRQDYDGRHGTPLNAEGRLSDWQREIRLDQYRRIRYLLGDERFAVYLTRVSPAFERMQRALLQAGAITPTVALDLWWLRQKDGAERDQVPTIRDRDRMTARLRARAAEWMGEAQLAHYSEDPDARWLVIPDRTPPVHRTTTATSMNRPRSGTVHVPERKEETP